MGVKILYNEMNEEVQSPIPLSSVPEKFNAIAFSLNNLLSYCRSA